MDRLAISAGTARSDRQGATKMSAKKSTKISIYIATIVICCYCSLAGAQSTKGQPQQVSSSGTRNSAPAPASPIAQIRQQQQSYSTTASSRPSYQSAAGTKQQQQPRRPIQQQQIEQQQQQQTIYGSSSRDDAPAQPTEDPLADSEPALYGSVAGAPGVDFPAYTRIPKTSFTCEGKGFDFGFYADEEAQCQVYHVCWSGRRESFLCGVGTVFNQAILACDYWHSVDCSKSSQFYGVNSELGKAGAEPAAGGSQRIQPARVPASPANQLSQNSASQSSYGSRPAAPQQQQQQYNSNDDTFDAPQQQQEIQQPVYASTKSERPAVSQAPPSVAQPVQQRVYQESTKTDQQSYRAQQQQRPQRVEQQQQESYPTKGRQSQRVPPLASTSVAPPPQPTTAQPQRQRFNMDFNQKVNSLIESPVRPPLVKPQPAAGTKQRQQPTATANYAQNAVARAQQSGSQTPNNAGVAARKSPTNSNNYQQQQQQQLDNGPEIDEQPPQQQQAFDDSPVQTSTARYGGRSSSSSQYGNGNNIPQQQVLTIRSGNSSPDGGSSSAITTQYDTMTPAGNANSDSPNAAAEQRSSAGPANDQSYESSLDDSGSANDDFRSAGAKAAASHNQNWYIMRSI